MATCIENIFNFSPHQLDTFIRLICQHQNYFYEDYMERKQGVFFENLFINHINQCQRNDSQSLCFCSRLTQDKLSSNYQNIKNVLGQDFRKQFLLNQIINLYKNYLNKADFIQKKYIIFSYLSFLIEQARNQTLSFQELFKAQQEYTNHKNWTNLIFIKNLVHLRALQKQLYVLHSKDSLLNSLSQIFQLSLDFYNTSNQSLKQKKKPIQGSNIELEDAFSPQCCSIYFSLISQFIQIKRTSMNFQQIFQIDQANTLGKQISNLLPKVLRGLHELTINDYINLGNKDSLISTGQRFAFALNGSGFIFPIQIRIKTENFQDDFGITALIKKENDLKQYILFNEFLQISEISSFIYERIFSFEYSLKQLKNQLIFNFIPLLDIILNSKIISAQNYYESSLILKRRKETQKDIISFKQCLRQQFYQNERLFSIRFKIKNLQSSHMKHIKYLEIEEFREEKSFLGKKNQINSLSQQLNIDFQLQDDNPFVDGQENNSLQQIGTALPEYFQPMFPIRNVYNNQEELSDFKIDSKNNLESQTQINFHDQTTNINIEGEITHSKSKISQENNCHVNSASKQSQLEQQSDFLTQRQEQHSFQHLISYSNKFINTQSHVNLNSLNQIASSILDKTQENSNFKQKSILKNYSVPQQPQIRQVNKIYNKKNSENGNFKHIRFQTNQPSADKLSDSPLSIALNHKNFQKNKFENIEEEEEFSIDCDQRIKKQFQNKNNQNANLNNSKIDLNEQEQEYQVSNSYSGSYLSIKKIIFKKITQNTNNKIILLIIFTGLISILFLQASALAFYFVNLNILSQISNLFNKFNYATVIKESASQFFKEQGFSNNAYTFQNVLDLNRVVKNPQDASKNITELFYLQNISNYHSRRAVMQYNQNINRIFKSNDEEFFKYISQTEIQTVSDFFDFQIFTRKISNHTILYSMLLIQSCLNQLYLQGNNQEYYPESVIFANFELFNSSIQKIQIMIYEQLIDLYKKINSVQMYQLIQTLISAICLIIIAIPFMFYFKSQQYQILKLLGTFHPKLLQNYISIFKIYLSHLDEFKKNQTENKLQDNYIIMQSFKTLSSKQIFPDCQNQSNQKRKSVNKNDDNLNNFQSKNSFINNLSNQQIKNTPPQRQRQMASFSQRKPFRTKYVLLSLLAISPFMIYPVFNLISINQFVEESRISLKQREILLNSSQYILSFEVVHYKIWQMAFYQPLFNQNVFFYLGKNLTQLNENILNGIKILTNQETSSRYDSSQRKTCFSRLLFDNICNYIDEINNQTIFNTYFKTRTHGQQCETLLNGNFQRGFILSFQYVANLFKEWFSIYERYSSLQTKTNNLASNRSQNQKDQLDSINYFFSIQLFALLAQFRGDYNNDTFIFSPFHSHFVLFEFFFYMGNSITVLINLLNPLNSFALLGLVSIPLSVKLGLELQKKVDDNIYKMGICYDNLANISPHQLDAFIRIICQNQNYFYEDYIEHKQGVFFESLFTNHIIQCEKIESHKFCFCSRFMPDQLNNHSPNTSIEDILGQQFRKQFILSYIVNLYQNYLDQANYFHKKQIVFSYLSFLNERAKNITKSYQELLKMEQEYTKHKDWSNLIYIKILINRVSSQEDSKVFVNQTNDNQKINMYDPITFDILMNEFQRSLKVQTQKQIEYFKYLCSDYFNLEELIKISQINLDGISNVRNLQKQLFAIQANDYALKSLSQIFQITLDFYNFSKKKLDQKQKQNQKSISYQEDVFSSECCSVYCSLIGQSINIKRISKNFQQIFQMEQTYVIGQDISYLLPQIMHDAHDLSINEFINLGNNDSVINSGERFAFAINGNGFIFPVNIRIKTEKFSNDFGVTALIKQVNDSKHFIILNEFFQITEISSYIYEKIFSLDYSLIELKEKLICEFIPLLGSIEKSFHKLQKEDEEKSYQTCLLLKRKNTTNQKITKLKNFMQKAIEKEDRVFSLVFKIRSLSSKNMKLIKYLEIEEFSEQKTFLDKKCQLNLLSRYLNIDFLFQEDKTNQKNYENVLEVQNYSSPKQNCQNNFEKKEEQLNNYKTDLNQNLENYSQLNIYNQLSNVINEIGREENINSEGKNFQLNQNSSASKQSQIEYQSDILSLKYEINSLQNLFSQSSRFLVPFSHQLNANCFSVSTLDKSQDYSNLKQKIKQLHQNPAKSNLNNTNANNQSSLKHIINSINQIQVEKSSDSSQSITQNNKQFNNYVQKNIRDNDELLSIKKKLQIQNQNVLQNRSNNYKIKQKKIISINEEDQYYQNSFNGNKNSQLSLRKQIMNKITQNSNTKIIRIIIFTGLMSIIFLQASVAAFYFLNKSNVDTITNLFKKYNTATIINESVFEFTKEQSFQQVAFIFQNILDLNHQMVDPNDHSKNITELAFRQNISRNHSKNAVKQFNKNINYILESRDEQFFKYISETEIETMSDFYDLTIYTHKTANRTILYTMLLFQSCLNQLFLQDKKGEYYPESVIFGNFEVFNTAILKIQVMIHDQLTKSYEQLKQTQINQLVFIVVSSMCLVIIAVPFMIYFKSQQYQIIKLLGSFPPQLLQYYINLLTVHLSHLENFEKISDQKKNINQQYNLKQSIKSLSTNHLLHVFDSQIKNQESNKNKQNFISNNKYFDQSNKKQQISKRSRQIASFSKEKAFKFNYILISIIIILPFMIQPVFNLISIDFFVDESLAALSQRNILLNSSQFLLTFQVVHLKIWEIIFVQPSLNMNFFYLFGKNITQKTDKVLDGIKSLTNYETNSRYDQGQRQMYFDSLLLDNICNYIEQINKKQIQNQYLKTRFPSGQCQKLLSGNFQRGFILSFEYMINLYKDWFSMYEQYAAIQTVTNNLQQNITQSIVKLQQTHNNLIDNYKSNSLLQQLIFSFENFFLNQNEKYTSFIIEMFEILMIVQMVLIFFAISVVWVSLYKKFKKELSETKLLLTNFHIDMILKNDLTLKYFKQK
ncbi:hypothetical protein ABPG74_013451 [Tetrahymena malaccensis]